jgi:hypothetical protein
MKKRKDGKKESLGIEKVTKEGEYVVALVEKDKKEGPMPVGETVFTPVAILRLLIPFLLRRYPTISPSISL